MSDWLGRHKILNKTVLIHDPLDYIYHGVPADAAEARIDHEISTAQLGGHNYRDESRDYIGVVVESPRLFQPTPPRDDAQCLVHLAVRS
jgi:hypothetical protein